MSNDKTFFIAWHPEYGYDIRTMTPYKDALESITPENGYKGHTIRTVRIVDVSNDGWISVDKVLPTTEGDYLVFDGRARSQHVATFNISDAGIKHWIYSHGLTRDITHWRPLPKAPHEKE